MNATLCKRCGGTFMAKYSSPSKARKFCDDCRYASLRVEVKNQCTTCGKEFSTTAKYRAKRTCSEACATNAISNSLASQMPLADQLLARCEQIGDCWQWTGALSSAGYGIANRRDIRAGQRSKLVHRLVWEELRGEIPQGLELDHLCRNRACCNPDHLDPVTHAVNVARSHRWVTA